MTDRKARAEQILSGSVAVEVNGFEIPSNVPRFLGTEGDDADVLWAFFSDDLGKIAWEFANSETEPASRRRAYDLDATPITAYAPVFEVVRWVEIEPIEVEEK